MSLSDNFSLNGQFQKSNLKIALKFAKFTLSKAIDMYKKIGGDFLVFQFIHLKRIQSIYLCSFDALTQGLSLNHSDKVF